MEGIWFINATITTSTRISHQVGAAINGQHDNCVSEDIDYEGGIEGKISSNRGVDVGPHISHQSTPVGSFVLAPVNATFSIASSDEDEERRHGHVAADCNVGTKPRIASLTYDRVEAVSWDSSVIGSSLCGVDVDPHISHQFACWILCSCPCSWNSCYFLL